MNIKKTANYLIGIILMSILLVFAYQGIIEHHLYYDTPKMNIRLDGYQAVFFGLINLIAAAILVYIFQSNKKTNDD